MKPDDTIVSPATPPGRGGIGIVRLSGPAAAGIARRICDKPLHARVATLCRFMNENGDHIDTGIALYFPAPNSFTGEDVAEFHAHGGPIILEMIVAATLAYGARHARPGEFSERSYLNGKLDLAQAEAIADLINSTSAHAARNALRSMQGDFSREVGRIRSTLVALRCFVEAAIDFPEEELDFLSDSDTKPRIDALLTHLAELRQCAMNGAIIREGIRIVLVGKPNGGKSSLMNAISGRDSAIVSPKPGTTRDIVREHLLIDGLALHLADTAGLRESDDDIEAEGMRRTLAEVAQADHVLVVVDATATHDASQLIEEHLSALGGTFPLVTVVVNKCDLCGLEPGITRHSSLPAVIVSAKTGAGIDTLCEHLKTCAGYANTAGEFSARPRHLHALEQARCHIENALTALKEHKGIELLAENLRLAQHSFGEITGEFHTDELLGEIFSTFCIGK